MCLRGTLFMTRDESLTLPALVMNTRHCGIDDARDSHVPTFEQWLNTYCTRTFAPATLPLPSMWHVAPNLRFSTCDEVRAMVVGVVDVAVAADVADVLAEVAVERLYGDHREIVRPAERGRQAHDSG